MYRKKAGGWLKHLDFILLDLLCLQGAFMLAYTVRMGPSSPYGDAAYRSLGIVLLLTDVAAVFFLDSFRDVLKRGIYREFAMTLRHDLGVEALAVVYLFTTEQDIPGARFVIYLTALLYVCTGYFTRLLWKAWLQRRLAAAGEARSLLIVTHEHLAAEVIEDIRSHHLEQYRITGLAVLDRDLRGRQIQGIPVVAGGAVKERADVTGEPGRAERADVTGAADRAGASVIGTLDVTEAVCRSWVDEALIVLPREEAYPEELASQLAGMGVVVHVGVYKAEESGGLRQFVGQLGDYTVLTTSISAATPLQQFAKRAMDIGGGIAGCVITAVLTLILGPAIWIASPGPIFFTQERVGRNGKKFRIYKFRSMYPDAEARKAALMEQNRHGDGLLFKMEGDPRIIGCKVLADGKVKKGIGNFIRDHSLDEFPQFLNVLKGDMSLVGTRPPTLDEWERYQPHHRARLAVRPGITGLWQVSGRSKITDFEEVVKLDTKYITEWSMALDLRILVKTVKVVFQKDGAM